jgi:hypothetical protein
MRTSTTQQPSEQSIQQLRDQIRENVRKQLQAEAEITARDAARISQEAAREAERAMQEAGIPVPPPPPGAPRITIQKDGRTVVIPTGPGEHEMTPVAGMPFPPEAMIPREAVIISIAFFIMIAVIAIGLPIARAFARRSDRLSVAAPALPADLTEQLRRLENAVETMAVEVERISEGQRFSAGLLREMHPIVQRVQGTPAPALLDRNENGDGR